MKTVAPGAEGFFPEGVYSYVTIRHTLQHDEASVWGFNLGKHSSEQPSVVDGRWKLLMHELSLPSMPARLNQVRGNRVICVEDEYTDEQTEADASFSFESGRACVVTSADCLPILLSDDKGLCVAAVHAGWQGLHTKIIKVCVDRIYEKAVSLKLELGDLCAYIAPSITQECYQVGEEFYQRFLSLDNGYEQAFMKDQEAGKYLADLKLIARIQLTKQGIDLIEDSGICSYQDPDYYSHRRATHENLKHEGRFASMIWRV